MPIASVSNSFPFTALPPGNSPSESGMIEVS
jgi:hypothetical protein